MKDIKIEGFHGKHFSPSVNFNSETGICSIEGESFLEDTLEFYEPLFEWVNQYTKEIKKPITFNFKLHYFNTSTSKCILQILYILKKYEINNGEVVVNWYYDSNEENIDDELEEVDDFKIETGIDINLIPE